MSKRFVNLWSFFSKEAQKLRDEEASVFSKEEQERVRAEGAECWRL